MAKDKQYERNRKIILDFIAQILGHGEKIIDTDSNNIVQAKYPCIVEVELLTALSSGISHFLDSNNTEHIYRSEDIDTTFILKYMSSEQLLEESRNKGIIIIPRSFTIKIHTVSKLYIFDIMYLLKGLMGNNNTCDIYYTILKNSNISDICDIDYISIDVGFLSDEDDESKMILINDKLSQVYIDIKNNEHDVQSIIHIAMKYIIDIYLNILTEISDIEVENNDEDYEDISEDIDDEETKDEKQKNHKFKIFTREAFLPQEDILIPDYKFINETYKFYNDINIEDMFGLEDIVPNISKVLLSMNSDTLVDFYSAGVSLLEFISSENKDKYISNKEDMKYNDIIVSLAYDSYCIFIIIDTKNKELYLHSNVNERVFNMLLELDSDITDEIQINIGYRVIKDGVKSYERLSTRYSDKLNCRYNNKSECIKNMFNRETIFDIFLKCVAEAMIDVSNIRRSTTNVVFDDLEPYVIQNQDFNSILKTIEDSGIFDNLAKESYGAVKFLLNDNTHDYLTYLQNRKFIEKDESLYHTVTNDGDNIMIIFTDKINLIDSSGNIHTANVSTYKIPFGDFKIIRSNKIVSLPESSYTKSGQVTKDMLKIVKYMEHINNNAEGQ